MKLNKLRGLIIYHVQCQQALALVEAPPEEAARDREYAKKASDKLWKHIRELEQQLTNHTTPPYRIGAAIAKTQRDKILAMKKACNMNCDCVGSCKKGLE